MKNLSLLLLLFLGLTIQSLGQQWDKVYKEKNGMSAVMKNNKYGYIDVGGKLIVQLIYDKVYSFQKTVLILDTRALSLPFGCYFLTFDGLQRKKKVDSNHFTPPFFNKDWAFSSIEGIGKQ